MPTILLTHTPEWRERYGEAAIAGLRALGELRLHESDAQMTPVELVAAARDCDIVVLDRLTPAPAEVFEGLERPVAVIRNAMDIRNIDIAAASRAGILVANAGPGFLHSVVELILALMVDIARGYSPLASAYRRGEPAPRGMGVQLHGKTAGIIGYGNLGRRLAEVLDMLGMSVLVSDPHARVARPGIEQVAMPDLLARSRFVICLAVHTPQTENLMDEAAFRTMRPDAFFLNVSRGGLVDEAALERALTEGWISGAALDVGRHTADDLPSPRLARLPNVVAVPHIGGLTPDATASQAQDSVDQTAAVLRGEMPRYALNPEGATRLTRQAGG